LRFNIGIANLLPTEIAWDVEVEVLIVGVNAVYCNLFRQRLWAVVRAKAHQSAEVL
jgi:hypothetical protein